jgi:hypothetical protein
MQRLRLLNAGMIGEFEIWRVTGLTQNGLPKAAQLKLRNVQHGNPPEPDIVADLAGESIGIEITGLDDQSISHRRGASEEIEMGIGSACDDLGLHGYTIKLYGLRADELSRIERAELVQSFSNLIRQIQLDQVSHLELRNEELPFELERYVTAVRFNRTTGSRRNHIDIPLARWCAPLDAATLQRTVDRKQGKRVHYRGMYSSVWLLITGHEFTSLSEIPMETLTYHFSSDFDRIFILWGLGEPHASELKVSH